MRFELQRIDDCPNWELASERLREALVATGHGGDPVSVRTVRDSGEAARMGFAGSPTIYADGIDLFPSADDGGALACRVYKTPAGLAGAPTIEQLVAAIERIDAADEAACSCCGRTLPRRKVHSLHHGAAYICRRCGFWVALQWRGDQRRPKLRGSAAHG
jgi:predicted RNA-binding Zn-ribbon protein involved in translation (DUF1610 family)